jgi:hypothetical protein
LREHPVTICVPIPDDLDGIVVNLAKQHPMLGFDFCRVPTTDFPRVVDLIAWADTRGLIPCTLMNVAKDAKDNSTASQGGPECITLIFVGI